jgi:hypothetical protein
MPMPTTHKMLEDDKAELRAEIVRIRDERDDAWQTLWLIVASNGGYTLSKDDADDYPGDYARLSTSTDVYGNITFRAFVDSSSTQEPK